MKKMLGTGALLLLIIYLLPMGYRVYAGAETDEKPKDILSVHAETDIDNVSADTNAAVEEVSAVQTAPPADEGMITVLVEGEPREMPLETYVEGVVAAEISPTFPQEAIRAQAVAARTYAVYKMQAARSIQHQNADVCDDYTHCAAYIDLAAAASGRWGDEAEDYTNVIRQAVQDTAGEIVTKDGEAIVAVFHAASAARTESAKDVWGTDISYLQSVASPGGSACENYEGTVRLTFEEFRAKALESYPAADLSGDPNRWFTASTRSEAGSVIVCTMGGVQVKGTDLRKVFGLNSTNFTLTIDDETISFHTIGYGHGVGLSQYGAKYLAEQGSTYEEILTHYYTGTEITKLAV